jgi:hypothetical protein
VEDTVDSGIKERSAAMLEGKEWQQGNSRSLKFDDTNSGANESTRTKLSQCGNLKIATRKMEANKKS